MRIIDTSAKIPDLYVQGQFDPERWKLYADAVRPGLRALCTKDMEEVLAAGYSWEKDFLPVLQLPAERPEKLRELLASFHGVTEKLDERLLSRFGRTVDADLILYLGLCSGAGWVTSLGGTPTVLFGVEKIIELDWCGTDMMNGLVLHELGHLYQGQYGVLERGFPEGPDRFLWQLFTEGVAMVFEQELVGDPDYYHEDRNGWKAFCETNIRPIAQAFSDDLPAMTHSTQRWFGDWVRFGGYGDVGYYLGARFVRFMLRTRDFDSLICAGIEEVRAGFDAFRASLE